MHNLKIRFFNLAYGCEKGKLQKHLTNVMNCRIFSVKFCPERNWKLCWLWWGIGIDTPFPPAIKNGTQKLSHNRPRQ